VSRHGPVDGATACSLLAVHRGRGLHASISRLCAIRVCNPTARASFIPGSRFECGWMPWCKREEHELTCSQRPFPCRLGCGQIIFERYATVRVVAVALSLLMSCSLRLDALRLPGCCRIARRCLTLCALQDHVMKQCPLRAQPCALLCGEMLREIDRLTHEHEECANRCAPARAAPCHCRSLSHTHLSLSHTHALFHTSLSPLVT
jgi:hypothetical protein